MYVPRLPKLVKGENMKKPYTMDQFLVERAENRLFRRPEEAITNKPMNRDAFLDLAKQKMQERVEGFYVPQCLKEELQAALGDMTREQIMELIRKGW